jgi:hypothetical protein
MHGRKDSRPSQQIHQHLLKPCVVCHKNPRCMIVIPCGHPCLCEECAEIISKNPMHNKCPTCDQIIERIQKIVL